MGTFAATRRRASRVTGWLGRPRTALAALAALGCLVAAGCSTGANSSSAPAGSTGPATYRGDFYTLPRPLTVRAPGTLIRAERVSRPRLDPPATIWRILYHSRDRTGHDVAVSGYALVPDHGRPGPRPVYAWAHGAQGQGDQCAPSRQIAQNLPPYGGQQVKQGAVVVATDYEGLGTPGEPTYLVGVAEGRAVLDSVRAAAQLPGVTTIGPVVLAGHSQGGGAALWAGQIAASYAPDLDVRGVVALAPAGEFRTMLAALAAGPWSHYVGNALLAADGLHAGYGTAFDPASFLTPVAIKDLPRVQHECSDATIARWGGHPVTDVVGHDPFSSASIARVLDAESPGAAAPAAPVLLAQGSADDEIPPAVSAQLHQRYCRLHVIVTRNLYPGADHVGVVDAAMTDTLAWIADRYRGRPATSDC